MMRKWNTPDDLAFLEQIMALLKDGRLLEPSTLGVASPIDLQGLAFPTVTLCKELDLPSVVVSRVTGRQEFTDATLRDVDLSRAKLAFSVWNNCRFERVCFNRANLNQARFFGCRLAECSFRSTDLKDASFSVGRHGAETEIVATLFDKADFRGASCSNLVLRTTSFLNCRLEGFVFDAALCDGVTLSGKYRELTFKGFANDGDRNRLRVDLSNAELMWLNADYGVDLRDLVLPSDCSCLVIEDRLRAVGILCSRLSSEAGQVGGLVASVLKALFSERAASPLEPTQDTVLISKAMIADFAETNDTSLVDSLFSLIRSISDSEGFLVSNHA